MKSIEYKLAALQQQTISNSTDSMDVVTPGDGSLYTEYAKALDEVAQKPIGRVASAVLFVFPFPFDILISCFLDYSRMYFWVARLA